MDNDVLRFMLEYNPHLTSREIAKEFGIHHTTVGDYIKYLGFELKQSVWVPRELTEKNLSDRRPEKGIVFHHDNARPHTAMVTHQKLNAFGWEDLAHPPYSPDIAPSDYYLFRSMQNYLTGKNSSLLKVFLRQRLAILRTKTSTKQEFTGYLKDGNTL
ncbi:histone-lysine N-methyltransferase SETMAR [Trichonephila clavipes]|nr:histone-lysine N-methyltransferase SETMAR [Trichonephila clavipes]